MIVCVGVGDKITCDKIINMSTFVTPFNHQGRHIQMHVNPDRVNMHGRCKFLRQFGNTNEMYE